MKDNIFIHIPKTGGSTFVNYLKDSLEPGITTASHHTTKVGNTEIRHLDFSSQRRESRCSDIFSEDNFEAYRAKYNIFTLVRHPVDRIISEFIFQRNILGASENAAIITKLHPAPNTLEEYIEFPEVHNYQTGFLVGKGVADKNPATQDDLDKIIDYMDNYPVYPGVTNLYNDFVSLFERITGYTLNRNIRILKETPRHLKDSVSANLSNDTKNLILERSNLDYILYLYALEKANDYRADGNTRKQYISPGKFEI